MVRERKTKKRQKSALEKLIVKRRKSALEKLARTQTQDLAR